MTSDHIYSIELTRARVERALLNLDERKLQMICDPAAEGTFLSRLLIALNTIASDLNVALNMPDHDRQATVASSANLLWRVGEEIGRLKPDFLIQEATRPSVWGKFASRHSLRSPVNQIFEAARKLADAVDAHLRGDRTTAAELISQADDQVIWDWTDSIWGKRDPAIHHFRALPDSPSVFPLSDRPKPRMPTADTKQIVIARDGYCCRFCGIPVIPSRVRIMLNREYPDQARWGPKNVDQHAALQCMWLQFDHVLPNKRGGDSSIDNIVITCAPCNYGRMDWTVGEAGLIDPRTKPPLQPWCDRHNWDGLMRLLD